MYEAIWIQRFQVNERQGKIGDYYASLSPSTIPGQEEIIASFKEYRDALVFSDIKAEELGLVVVDFLKKDK